MYSFFAMTPLCQLKLFSAILKCNSMLYEECTQSMMNAYSLEQKIALNEPEIDILYTLLRMGIRWNLIC